MTQDGPSSIGVASLPLVSVVLLNWNGDKYLKQCCKSVVEQTYKNIEVIIVDNGSTDGSLEAIELLYPFFKFLRNGSNLGFSQGMNIGLDQAQGKYVMPLNLDVFLEQNYIFACVGFLEASSPTAAVGGQEKLWKDGELTSVDRLPSGALFLQKTIKGVFVNYNFPEPLYCFGVTGSFPLLRRSAVAEQKRIHGFVYDPAFETGWEDMDLWFRFHHRAARICYLPNTFAWHVGSGSAEGNSTFLSKNFGYKKRILRNRYYLIIKNLPAGFIVRNIFSLILVEAGIIVYLLVKNPFAIGALGLAWLDVLRNSKILIEKRRLVMASSLLKKANLAFIFNSTI